jgi:hypothetical protein
VPQRCVLGNPILTNVDQAKAVPKIKSAIAISLLSALFVSTCVTTAMPLPQFDKMSVEDRSQFTAFLVKGAYEWLIASGRPADAEKLTEFFEDGSKKGGTAQFKKNLQVVRVVNRINAENRSNRQRPYEVEDAFSLNLKNAGFNLPVDSLLRITKNFKSSGQSQ